jgi:hypothetical protein
MRFIFINIHFFLSSEDFDSGCAKNGNSHSMNLAIWGFKGDIGQGLAAKLARPSRKVCKARGGARPRFIAEG